MIRTLLATTAVAAVLALPVIAQDASSSMDPSMSSMESSAMDSSMSSMESSAMDSSMMSSQMPMDSSSMVSTEPGAPFDIITGYTRIDSDRFATRIIGQQVYDSTAADANVLGNINDLVINENGTIAAVTIGVGGFLGIGEKQVAVAYSALQWTVAADNTERFVLETTVDDLTQAPDFVVVEDDPADGDAMAPAGGDAMAPADTNTQTSSSAAQ